MAEWKVGVTSSVSCDEKKNEVSDIFCHKSRRNYSNSRSNLLCILWKLAIVAIALPKFVVDVVVQHQTSVTIFASARDLVCVCFDYAFADVYVAACVHIPGQRVANNIK